MGYADELLSAHAALAAELETEPEETLVRRGAWRKARGGSAERETEKKKAGGSGETMPETAGDGAQAQKERGAAALLQEMLRLAQAGTRASLRAVQLQSERALQSAQETQGVQPSAMRHSRYEGGLGGGFLQTLESEGVSGMQTQRSMREISRFFERDARRYGG